MRANVGEIARTDEGLALMNELFDTNAEIARRAGFAPSAAFLDDYRATLDRKSTSTASMLRDIESKGQIEADHIIGYLLRKAREYGIDDRLLRVIYIHLKAYEQRREAKRL
jgi:2-dehydropantoate 2-reductase